MLTNLQNLFQSYRNTNPNFKDLEIGCSFDPLHQIFFEKDIKPIEVLKYIHKELKINNIRLSIRWNKDFEFYKPYLDYCIEFKLKVVMNVGPIKVMRWPEEHISEEFKVLLRKGDVIDLCHPIVEPALEYLEQTLENLKVYKNIIAIQADNELFNAFGEYSLKISTEFELKVIETIHKQFPKLPVYINSSGVNDFKKIFEMISNLENKIILGVNYYYKTKFQNRIPIINKLDNLILKKPFAISVEDFKKIAEKKNYQIEVSELQGEPWWPNAKSPGNNFKEFKFTLLRTQFLKPISQKEILARYWGIEDLVSKLMDKSATTENLQIKDLIIKINQ